MSAYRRQGFGHRRIQTLGCLSNLKSDRLKVGSRGATRTTESALGAYFAICLLLVASSFTASAPVYAEDRVTNGEASYEPQEILKFLLSSGKTLTCVCSYSPVRGSINLYHWVCT